VLELASYPSIVACVASGTGIAFVPRSVLATIRTGRHVAVYPLPPAVGKATTALVWRKGEQSLALEALREEIPVFKAATASRKRSKKPSSAAE
jgi:DNA-binding transcriptional LysR family regulator